MLVVYIHQTVKARFQCSHGHIWAARPNNVLLGKGCPSCRNIAAAKRMQLSADTVRDRLASRGIILLGEYVSSQTRDTLIYSQAR